MFDNLFGSLADDVTLYYSSFPDPGLTRENPGYPPDRPAPGLAGLGITNRPGCACGDRYCPACGDVPDYFAEAVARQRLAIESALVAMPGTWPDLDAVLTACDAMDLKLQGPVIIPRIPPAARQVAYTPRTAAGEALQGLFAAMDDYHAAAEALALAAAESSWFTGYDDALMVGGAAHV